MKATKRFKKVKTTVKKQITIPKHRPKYMVVRMSPDDCFTDIDRAEAEAYRLSSVYEDVLLLEID